MPHLSHRRAVMLGRRGGRATARSNARRYNREMRVTSRHQTGRTNVRVDRRYKALHPGKRVSHKGWGKKYYEYRKNRSDKNRTRRL